MAGRPPCLWTCLSSLVKPVDLNNIKTAIYEKAWRKKTHKHPATETIKCHLISQRALLQDESRTAETPIDVHSCAGMVVRSRCSDYTQVHFFLCEGVLFACLGCERRTLAVSKFLPEKRRSKTNRAVCIQVEAEPQNHSLACGSQHTVPALTSPKTNTLKTRPPQPKRERNLRKKSLDLNSINQSALSHRVLLCSIFFSPSAGHTQIFSLACHLCRSCALWGHARTESKVCERTELGGKRG